LKTLKRVTGFENNASTHDAILRIDLAGGHSRAHGETPLRVFGSELLIRGKLGRWQFFNRRW
jgi:hypothetical protein